MITSSFGDGSSLSSPQHYDHHTIIKKKQKEGGKKTRISRDFPFLVFWWGGGCVCVCSFDRHPYFTAPRTRGRGGKRKNSLISCGGLSYGFRVSCPNGGERRPRNRWRIHATLVIYDLTSPSPACSFLLWFAFPFWAKEGVFILLAAGLIDGRWEKMLGPIDNQFVSSGLD